MGSEELATILSRFSRLVEEVGGNDPIGFDYIQHRNLAHLHGASLYSATIPDGVQIFTAGIGVDAEWIVPESRDDSLTILYLPGGGYYDHPSSIYQPLAARLALAAKTRLLLLNYRLAPEHPFPAALEDALEAYDSLLESVQSPIVLCGDSAGGGLALATLLAIRDSGRPLPDRVAVISPWTDLTLSGESMKSNLARDPIGAAPHAFSHIANLYLQGHRATDPLVSPLYGELHALPPIFIQVGERELLRDDAVRFADKARHSGVNVSIDIWPEVPHVWHLYATVLPEARRAIADIAEFLRRL